MKIRASWGIIGNQNITPYSTLASLNATSFNYGTNTNYTGYWAGGITTPDLTWEKVKPVSYTHLCRFASKIPLNPIGCGFEGKQVLVMLKLNVFPQIRNL